MKKKTLLYLSNGALIIGAVIGVYALTDIYLLKSRLPSGVCPITNDRPLLYIGIVLCCISFILSFFEHKAKSKKDKNNV